MKRREDRLRGILELVEGREAAGYDEKVLIGRIAREYAVAAGTVRDDLEDLELRGWVSRRFGVVRCTERGSRILAQEAVPPAGQKSLEEVDG